MTEGRDAVRPAAIIWFERLFLCAIALKMVVMVLSWRTANPGAAQLGLILWLLLWFGVVHRHSLASRWLAMACCLISAIWTLLVLIAGAFGMLDGALSILAALLMLGAALRLSSLDADGWFKKSDAAASGE